MQNNGISLTATADKDMRFYLTYYFIFLFTFSLFPPPCPHHSFRSSPPSSGRLHPPGRGPPAGPWKRGGAPHQLRHQGQGPPPRAAHRCTERRHAHRRGAATERPQPRCAQQGVRPAFMCLNVNSGSTITMCGEEKWIVMCFYECKKKKKIDQKSSVVSQTVYNPCHLTNFAAFQWWYK